MPRIMGTANNGSFLYIDYSVAQNVAGNYTDVTWTAGVHWGSYYFNIHDAIVNMSTTTGASATGTTTTNTYNSGWPISGSGTNRDHAFKSGTTRINHNSSTGVGNIHFAGSADWDTPSNFTSTMNATVALATIPRGKPAPSRPVLSAITSTSIFATFTDGAGGAPTDARQLAYNTTNSTTGATTITSDGSTAITGLAPGTTYYIFARTHNAAGYSPWSPSASATTLKTPTPPAPPTISSIQTTSVVVSWTIPANGGSPIIGYEVGYGTNPAGPTTSVSAASPKTITGLSPGTKYFFWVRAMNSIGWSAYSNSTSATTQAAARIKVGGVWKNAVPWIKVAGVWRIAKPWVRTSGVWKETI